MKLRFLALVSACVLAGCGYSPTPPGAIALQPTVEGMNSFLASVEGKEMPLYFGTEPSALYLIVEQGRLYHCNKKGDPNKAACLSSPFSGGPYQVVKLGGRVCAISTRTIEPLSFTGMLCIAGSPEQKTLKDSKHQPYSYTAAVGEPYYVLTSSDGGVVEDSVLVFKFKPDAGYVVGAPTGGEVSQPAAQVALQDSTAAQPPESVPQCMDKVRTADEDRQFTDEDILRYCLREKMIAKSRAQAKKSNTESVLANESPATAADASEGAPPTSSIASSSAGQDEALDAAIATTDKTVKPAVVAASVDPTGRAMNPPVYPREEERRGITGAVGVRIVYSANGEILDVEVSKSSGNVHLDKAALSAARRWKVNPGSEAGVPTAGELEEVINFGL